jgi:hypothetical protein
VLELVLEHVSGPLAGQRVQFGADKIRITVGRDPACDVVFPQDIAGIGPEHLDLVRDAGHYELRVNSIDPVLVNGERVGDGWEVADGDEIRLGSPRGPAFRVRLENHPGVAHHPVRPAQLPDDARSLKSMRRMQQLLVVLLAVFFAVSGWLFLRARRAETELRDALAQVPEQISKSGAPARFSRAIATASDGVYLVLSKAEGVGESALGTAWVVGKDLLATNAHVAEVLDELAEEGEGRVLVVRASRAPHPEFRVTSVDIHPGYQAFEDVWDDYAPTLIDDRGQVREMDFVPGYDVALMHVDAGDDLGAPLRIADDARLAELDPGDPLAFVGFPTENLIDSDLTEPNPTSQVANVVAWATFMRTKPVAEEGQLLEHSLPVTGGASGSPIINERGDVVAILSAQNAVMSPFAGRTPSAALVNYGQRVDVLAPLLSGEAVDLEPLRAQWKRDLARYPSRQKITARIVKDSLATWKEKIEVDGDPQVLFREKLAIGTGDKEGDAPGVRHKFEIKPGHYLAIAVSGSGRDIDAQAYRMGSEEPELLFEDTASDHYPMLPFDLDEPAKVEVAIVDANFEASDERPRSEMELALYYFPPQAGSKRVTD